MKQITLFIMVFALFTMQAQTNSYTTDKGDYAITHTDKEYVVENSNTGVIYSPEFSKKVFTSKSISSFDNILVYEEIPDFTYYATALDNLALSYTLITNMSDIEAAITDGTDWDLIIYNSYNNGSALTTLDALDDYVTAGGKLIFSDWKLYSYPTHTLFTTMGVEYVSNFTTPINFSATDTAHSIFNNPNEVVSCEWTHDQWGTDGNIVNVIGSAVQLAAFEGYPDSGAVVLNGNSFFNAFQSDNFHGDADSDGKANMVELIENQIIFFLLPANDNICDAINLNVGEVYPGDTFTNVYATAEVGEPIGSCTDGDVDASVWFTFTAIGAEIIVSTDIEGGTMEDSEITIFEAPTDCADASTMGVVVGCDQDGGSVVGSGWMSIAELTDLTVGDTYYIQVDRWFAPDGTFGISVIAPPPLNDECADAIELIVGDNFDENAIEATLVGATTDYDVADVWFSVTVPDSGALTVETAQATGSVMDDTFMYYFNECGGAQQGISDDDGEGLFSKIELSGLTAGDNLIFAVVKDWDLTTDLGSFMVSAYDHTVGVADATIEGFAMYPNPVEDVLTLNAQNTIDAVSIYNLLGQEVLQVTPSATETQINMSNLPTGAYVVKVQAGEQVGSYNLIKE